MIKFRCRKVLSFVIIKLHINIKVFFSLVVYIYFFHKFNTCVINVMWVSCLILLHTNYINSTKITKCGAHEKVVHILSAIPLIILTNLISFVSFFRSLWPPGFVIHYSVWKNSTKIFCHHHKTITSNLIVFAAVKISNVKTINFIYIHHSRRSIWE